MCRGSGAFEVSKVLSIGFRVEGFEFRVCAV